MAEKSASTLFESWRESIGMLAPAQIKTTSLITLGQLLRAVSFIGKYHWGIVLMLLFPMATDSFFLWTAEKLSIPLNTFLPAARIFDFCFSVIMWHLMVIGLRPSLEPKDMHYSTLYTPWIWLTAAVTMFITLWTAPFIMFLLLFFYDQRPTPLDAIKSLGHTIKVLIYFAPVILVFGLLKYVVLSPLVYSAPVVGTLWSGFEIAFDLIQHIITFSLITALYTTIKHKSFKLIFQ